MATPRTPRRKSRLVDWIDGIEIILYAIGSVVVVAFAVFLGVRSTYRVGGPLLAAAPVALLVVVLAGSARDFLRRRWSPLSVILLSAYCLALITVVVIDAAS